MSAQFLRQMAAPLNAHFRRQDARGPLASSWVYVLLALPNLAIGVAWLWNT